MLLANRDGSVGGAQRQARLLADEVKRYGVQVLVVNQAPRRTTTSARAVPDGDVERVSLPIVGRAARWSFLLSFLVWATVNRRRFDLIHAHSTAAGLTAGLVGRLLHRPVIVKVTGIQAAAALGDRAPGWRLRRFILETTAQVVVAVSTEMMHALSEVGIPRDRRVLIPNGVRLAADAADTRAATKTAWLGDSAGSVVLYVGRLEAVKGVQRLLTMWSAMPRRDAATLVIVGDGPLRAELERETAARGLRRSVRFLGSQPDVTPFYVMADVFVLPSTSEGLSNALLEAMAARLPVVASDVGGNRDVVEGGVSGFLVDWADTSAAAGLVGRLLHDAALRERVGEAAARRAGAFSISAVAERYCDLYRTVLARDAIRHESAR
jgi:glycosyltransferase involved in cell wall biosynthesis